MAEAAILLAVSKIGAVIVNDAVSAVVEKLSKKAENLRELQGKVKRIEDELMMISGVIKGQGTTQLSNDAVKTWISLVRKLAYRVEDLIDKYLYEALKLKEQGFLRKYIVMGNHHYKVFSQIAKEVEEIEKDVKHVGEMRSNWTNAVQPIKNEHADIDMRRNGRCFPDLINDDDLVGIDENRSKLTEWLTIDDKEHTLITVSGMGGLGKTTLVKNVYDRESAKFPDAHAWIVVSQAYDVVDLLGTVLSKISHTQQPQPPLPINTRARPDFYELAEAIKKILQDKKCLIVLDDVWDKEAYTKLQRTFQGLQGSRVVITTRIDDVAALALEGRRLQLQPLDMEESFNLFCRRAFHNRVGHNCPQALDEVARSVVKRCHGLPLAIVSAGSLLSTRQIDQHAWKQVYNHLRSKLHANNHVQEILQLSYHDMPGDLRNCFLYCSMFPEDYPILGESLVRLWVAEGFAVKTDNSTPEEVAEGNLMELIGRNMLQVVERDELNRVRICKMHDIVRDLALVVAREERFGTASDQAEMSRMDKEVRRLSACGWKKSTAMVAAAAVEFPHLRTMISLEAPQSSTNMISSVLTGSSYLTVLELQDSEINQVPETIGDLFNLRYIGLRRTKVRSLPKSIEKLSNLQTLDIKQTKIEKLPPAIVKVEKLRHLLADRFADEKRTEFRYFVGVEAPKGISKLEELQTLETVQASKDLPVQLKKMNKLQTLWIDNISAADCQNLFSTLSAMPHLSSLLLSACDEKEILCFESLKPVSNGLRKLIVRGGWADGILKSPIFQGNGKYLKYLALSWCNLGKEDPLQILASHVPALAYLSLNTVSSADTLVVSAGSFTELKTLVLKRMLNVKKIVIEKNALPCIEGIYIVSLSGLSMVPSGIEYLGSLKKLWLCGLHKDFKAEWALMENYMKHVPDIRT
ncbi:disease resistance protein RPM1-like [Lolium rigidum]|uniref:disease resistance protein RPM1-like n=1 Tax=Lolium rigidum TaxID=89674 RepID=UPI001F5CD11A|nr:disease resistance protein RPM1-like [Lolium rigidum]